MRMTIVAVGRAKAGPERDLVQHYLKRMAQPLNLKEVEAKAAIDAKRSEGEKLLAAAPKNAVIVALDERGKDLSSRQLADRIAGWRDDGIRDIAFLIGGADGLDGRVRENADSPAFVRSGHLATHADARHARRTDLSGPVHTCRPPLSPRLNAFRQNHEQPASGFPLR